MHLKWISFRGGKGKGIGEEGVEDGDFCFYTFVLIFLSRSGEDAARGLVCHSFNICLLCWGEMYGRKEMLVCPYFCSLTFNIQNLALKSFVL